MEDCLSQLLLATKRLAIQTLLGLCDIYFMIIFTFQMKHGEFYLTISISIGYVLVKIRVSGSEICKLVHPYICCVQKASIKRYIVMTISIFSAGLFTLFFFSFYKERSPSQLGNTIVIHFN